MLFEGFVFGVIIGLLMTFITLEFKYTLLVSALGGVVLRYLFDFTWSLYNRITGKV